MIEKYFSDLWRTGLLLILVSFSIHCKGQVDSTYIQKLPNQKVIGVLSSYRHFKIQFSDNSSSSKYYQVTDLGLGLRFKYRKIGASISIPVYRLNAVSHVPPKSLGLQFRWYPHAYFFSGGYQTIHGMNTFDPVTGITTLDPDANLNYGTLSITRLMTPRKWNMRSGFRYIDIQRKNAGSWLLNVMTEYQHLESSTGTTESEQGLEFDLKNYHAWRWTVGGGYGYTFVFPNFYISTMTLLGPELRSVELTTSQGDVKRTALRLNPRILSMASVTHNTADFFYGIVGSYQPSFHRSEYVDAGTQNLRIRFTLGWRFDGGSDIDPVE